jgi:AraC family transcriptional regulator, regulatory protein of adaptative response / methylated-DNA-[protein]-cysteine methyltransferase
METPLGPMLAMASEDALALLEFTDRRMLPTQLKIVAAKFGASAPATGPHPILDLLAEELARYFQGTLREFTVPIKYPGSAFQTEVWNHLLKIPYGETLSYSDLAREVGRPDAQRAVGKANGDNRLGIIIPCHRVIRSDGNLCGYGGGIWRKRRLLDLESGQLSFD